MATGFVTPLGAVTNDKALRRFPVWGDTHVALTSRTTAVRRAHRPTWEASEEAAVTGRGRRGSLVEVIAADTFARQFSQRSGQLAWLLGAGTSASAGIPTGWDMIADFKARLFCAQIGVPRAEVDPTDPIWEERIAAYFDGAHGLPPAGDPDEYAAAFEAVFPEARDRRAYIEAATRQGSPSYGHRVIAALITAGLIRCIFTTNFDPLVEQTTVLSNALVPPGERAHLTVSALDSAERAARCIREDAWPLLVKLHGDYQSERLKNTTLELQTQDEVLRKTLIDASGRFGLVVAGYSGRDHSIMDALDEAVSAPAAFVAGLYWVARPGARLLPRVTDMLERAAATGVAARIVESENFDELCGDIERETTIDATLRPFLEELRPRPLVEPVSLTNVSAELFPVLRLSALELLQIPDRAIQVVLEHAMTTVEARQLAKDMGARITVASRGTTLVAFGSDDEIDRAFGPVGGRRGDMVDIDPARSSIDRGLVYDAFARALCRERPLRPVLRGRGHQVLVHRPGRNDAAERDTDELLGALKEAYGAALTGSVPRIDRSFAEALHVRLEMWEKRWWCVYEPFTWVDLRDADDASRSVAADWRRERWAQRYNPRWNNIIAAWAKLMAPNEEAVLETHQMAGIGLNASFRISWTTAWCSPGRRPNVTEQ